MSFTRHSVGVCILFLTITGCREMSDSWFEALNLIECMAMWLLKHAAWVAGKDEVRPV